MKILERAQAEGTSVVDLSTMMRRHMANRDFATPAVKNWNRELQELLDMDPCEEKYLKLRELAHDFNLTAEVYAKILISELFLSPSEKTIPPSTIGGLAGGTKFICQGILFKFAVDVQLPDSNFWMYGKYSAATEYAMKAAGSELRHIVALSNAVGDTDLRVPLMALIDYRGFRLVASSLLPIASHTIVYGSDNAGFNVYAQTEVATKFDLVAKRLNLKKHTFGDVEISGPVDIEIHRGEDQRLYVIDVARLMPPEAPDLSLIPHPRSNYFKMLRPCLVFKYHQALSSDAFSGFGRADEEVHNNEVWLATKFLLERVIPDMAIALNDGKYKIKTGSSLCQILHKAGINLRYLGLLRCHLRKIDEEDHEQSSIPSASRERRDSVHSGQSGHSGHSTHSASTTDLTALLAAARASAMSNIGTGKESASNSTGPSPTSSPPSTGANPNGFSLTERSLKPNPSSFGLKPHPDHPMSPNNRASTGPVDNSDSFNTSASSTTKKRSSHRPTKFDSKSEKSTPSPLLGSPIFSSVRQHHSTISRSNDTISASVESEKKSPLDSPDMTSSNSSISLNNQLKKSDIIHSSDQTSSEASSRASLTASRASDSISQQPKSNDRTPNEVSSDLSVMRDLDNSATLLVFQHDRSGTSEIINAIPLVARPTICLNFPIIV